MSEFYKQNKWINFLLAFVIMQFIFGIIYFACFKYDPCNFLYNYEINLNPLNMIRDSYENNFSTKEISEKDLLEYSSEINLYIDEINKLIIEIEELDALIVESENELKELSTRYNQTVNDGIDSFVTLRTSEIEGNINILQNEKLNLENVLDIAKHDVAVAELKLELANERINIFDFALKNLSSFGDPELLSEINALEKEVNNHRQIFDSKEKDFRNLRARFPELWIEIHSQRSNHLNFIDFQYFSFVTSTTTGYGDIIPNNSVIRGIVILQIIIGLLNFGLLLKYIPEKST